MQSSSVTLASFCSTRTPQRIRIDTLRAVSCTLRNIKENIDRQGWNKACERRFSHAFQLLCNVELLRLSPWISLGDSSPVSRGHVIVERSTHPSFL
jgi:hypothetical protein